MQRVAPRFVCLIAISFVAFVAAESHGQTSSDTQHDPRSISIGQSIAKLRSDSFASRQFAQQRLLAHAKLGGSQFHEVKTQVMSIQADRDDLELFLARQRLLDQLDQFAHEIQIDRFLHDPSFDAYTLSGWPEFSRHAGTDHLARSIFVQILHREPSYGKRLAATNSSIVQASANPRQRCQIDSIERNDSLAWAMLLAKECHLQTARCEEVSLRLVATLRCFGSGPMPTREREQAVIGRLVDSYLEDCPTDLRDRVVIATRFQCWERAKSLCRSILKDPSESPSRIVTALLAAHSIGMEASEIDRWLNRYRNDDRTSHVWRSLNPPKVTHRTQVRDVALALRLHRQGIDPREKGFVSLEADPIMVFRAYSLGFETQEKRDESQGCW